MDSNYRPEVVVHWSRPGLSCLNKFLVHQVLRVTQMRKCRKKLDMSKDYPTKDSGQLISTY